MYKHLLVATDGSKHSDKAVVHATRHTPSAVPWESILAAARKSKCDVVVMGSHGRGGIAALLLGSETQRVLAHSKLPVIVVR